MLPSSSRANSFAPVLGGIEGVRGGLVDRQRPGLGGRVGHLAGVDLAGLERPIELMRAAIRYLHARARARRARRRRARALAPRTGSACTHVLAAGDAHSHHVARRRWLVTAALAAHLAIALVARMRMHSHTHTHTHTHGGRRARAPSLALALALAAHRACAGGRAWRSRSPWRRPLAWQRIASHRAAALTAPRRARALALAGDRALTVRIALTLAARRAR